jgi:hypothetical protein
MKGLLHRLAARAAGTAVRVQSDVRLPFGGGDLGFGEAVETDVVPRHPVASRPAPLRDPAEAQVRQSGEHATTERDAAVPAPMVDVPAAQPGRSSKPSHDIPIGHEPRPHVPSAEPGSGMKFDTPSPLLGPISTVLAQPPALETTAPALDTTRSLHRAPEPLLPPGPPRSDREPALLMPTHERGQATAPGAPPVAPRASAWSTPMAPTGAPREPTEVHIHIGRIDVNALHDGAPAPRRRPAAATPAPMSLDAYLARRSRS